MFQYSKIINLVIHGEITAIKYIKILKEIKNIFNSTGKNLKILFFNKIILNIKLKLLWNFLKF